jgi:hypothetical protein
MRATGGFSAAAAKTYLASVETMTPVRDNGKRAGRIGNIPGNIFDGCENGVYSSSVAEVGLQSVPDETNT